MVKRAAGLALLALAACGSGEVYRPPAELVAAYDRQMGGPPPAIRPDPRFIPAPRSPAELQQRMVSENAAAEAAARGQAAEAICAARADMAAATYAGRGFGLAGAVSAGMEAAVVAERVRTACVAAFRQTGAMPSL